MSDQQLVVVHQPQDAELVSHTRAESTGDIVTLWLQSYADSSPHTQRLYARIATTFIAALGVPLRAATVDDIQAALAVLRVARDGTPAKPTSVAAAFSIVRRLLTYAHTVGYLRFNAAPLIKIKRPQRALAQRILSEVDMALLLRAAAPGRDSLMLRLAYASGMRVSELTALTWADVIPRDSGEAQLSILGKGSKRREVLIPADIAGELMAQRGEPVARVFAITPRRFNYIVKAAAVRAGVNPKASAHWFRHAHASHSLDGGAPISLVQATLGHADLQTTSAYVHARPGDSSARYLKVRG